MGESSQIGGVNNRYGVQTTALKSASKAKGLRSRFRELITQLPLTPCSVGGDRARW
jgi:hypothetical protein